VRVIARVFVLVHLAAALVALAPRPARAPGTDRFPGFPAELDGRALVSVPLTAAEARQLAGFPGRVGRFTDGSADILVRWIDRPTRALHPGSDCLRAGGWTVTPEPLEIDRKGRAWGRVLARRGADRRVLAERIFDEAGASWSDASSWYWAALLGRTRGPWWAVSVGRSDR
jgi:hypothetical protein